MRLAIRESSLKLSLIIFLSGFDSSKFKKAIDCERTVDEMRKGFSRLEQTNFGPFD